MCKLHFVVLLSWVFVTPGCQTKVRITDQTPVESWPVQVAEIEYLSAADDTLQPAMFYQPAKNKTSSPLLVSLHSWSGDYTQLSSGKPHALWCIDKEWVFIFPNFRGPNWTPQATGSELVVGDIISAVDYARQNTHVDLRRIYLIGSSGGGHAAMLLAGRAPQLWTAVSAWVGITDIKAWYFECEKAGRSYAGHIIKACGGIPLPGSTAEEEYRKRSPLTYLAAAKNVPLDINAGIHDRPHRQRTHKPFP